MAIPEKNWTWQQGADLTLGFTLQSGPPSSLTGPLNITGYSFRMDVRSIAGQLIYTFNSGVITDTDPETAGNTPDSITEITTQPSLGQFTIQIPRTLTLPGGSVYTLMNNPSSPQLTYNYDVFMRDATGKQAKILKGQIVVEKSYTLWT